MKESGSCDPDGRTRGHLHLSGFDAQQREVFDNAKTKDGRPAHPVNLICPPSGNEQIFERGFKLEVTN